MRVYLFFISIILVFNCCNHNNHQTASKFYSTVEKNNEREISKFLEDVKDEKQRAIFEFLWNKREFVTHQYSDSLLDFQKVRALNNQKEYAKAKILADSIIENDSNLDFKLQDFLQLERLKAIAELNTTFSKEFDIYEQSLIYASSYYELYHYSQFLNLKARTLFAINLYSDASVTAQYGRFLLYENDLLEQFPISNSDFLGVLASFADEKDELQYQCPKIKRELLYNYEALGYNNLAAGINLDLMNCEEDYEECIRYLDSLVRTMEDSWLRQVTAFNLIDEVTYYNPESIIENSIFYEQLISNYNYDKGKCSAIIDIAYAGIYVYDFQFAMKYYNIADQIKSNSKIQNLWMKNYKSEFLKYYNNAMFEATGNSVYLDSSITALTQTFQQTKHLFPDLSENHLDDYYIELTAGLASLLEKKVQPSEAEIDTFFSFLQYAQANEVALQNANLSKERMTSTYKRDSLQYECSRILREIGGWSDILDASNPKIKDLYFTTTKKRQAGMEQINLPRYSSKVLMQILENEEACLIGYVNSTEILTRYVMDGNGVHFSTLNLDTVKNDIEKILDAVHTEKKISNSQYDSFLPPIDDKYKKIYLCLDGQLNKVPFSYEISKPISIVTSPKEIFDFKPKNINTDNASLFSLTSEQTNRDVLNKSLHPELFYGMKACNTIANTLDIPESNLYYGVDMNRENILANLGNDIVHISTHGYTNDSVLNDNWLIIRDEVGMTEMYTTDFDFLPEYPSFIFLDGCNTAKGINQTGEGTYSLSRIFAKNTVDGMIKTLWSIDEKSAGEFAKMYYSNWKEGMPSGAAFHKAQQDMKASFPSVRDWAPFVYEGNPNLILNRIEN